MSCPGLHCKGCKETGGLAIAALIIATMVGGLGAVVAWVLANLELIAVGICAVTAVVLTVTVRAIRRELRSGSTWHGEARTHARVNGPAIPVPAVPAPAVPVLTAAQITGLAELGQAVMDVRAHGAHAVMSRAPAPATIITDAQEIER